MNSQEIGIYYAEIYEILTYLGDDYIIKLPKKLIKLIEHERKKDYISKFDKSKPLYENNFSEYTINFIALLNVKYWIDDEDEKKELLKQYKNNDIIYEKELSKKYSYENLFNCEKNENVINKDKIDDNITKEEYHVAVIKETIFDKIRNIFKNLFNKLRRA